MDYYPHASGGTLGIKKNIHERIGGFDEEFRYVGDTEYCWRVQREGIKLHFVADAVMHMRYRPNLWETMLQAVKWATYNIKLYKKYLGRGIPEYSHRQSVFTLKKFLKKFPQLFSNEHRQRYIRRLGMIIGSIIGSIKYRIFIIQ